MSEKSRATLWRNFLLVTAIVVSFLLGWFLEPPLKKEVYIPSHCLRLSGYHFTQPLLACDNIEEKLTEQTEKMRSQATKVIEDAIKAGGILSASVYVRLPTQGQQFSINPDESFFPASLKKVPLFIRYLKESEKDPSILQKRITLSSTDYNSNVAIPPGQFPQPGGTYTVQQLLEYMIKYSDNNSFQALLDDIGVAKFNEVYRDLQLYYPDNVVAIDDYMSAYQFSLFFRTLFNTSYLTIENSENALRMLSQSEYRNGIVGGLPSSVEVAHKFGIGVVDQGESGKEGVGELHDCGIVYATNNPYILCVMTKSNNPDLNKVEKVIANISASIYQVISRN